MDLGENELSENYTLALKLHHDGVDTAGIAARLGIEPEAVPPLLRLAEAKLDRIQKKTRSLDEIAPEG
ncbi:MAG TPA: hypothetical protein VHV82_08030 [Sporichthyaceae bacterium]|jgi:hypothetical protein|nr:hypothetical protein [Sporichthyaceae bacterium]